ncbi:hypothetical protein GF327_05940 [Candidatus Woesearchaeota archaeon]|nr:hypothetical protein [Candidatus Woesearchaeota archaeon]
MLLLEELIKKLFPDLEITLRKAGKKDSCEEYIHKFIKLPVLFSIVLNFFVLLVVAEGVFNRGWNIFIIIILLPIFIIITFFCVMFFFSLPKMSISSRKTALESDILYSSRFLLLKLESGAPILNALIEASKLNTKSSQLFREIVTDIYLGTPIEEALDIGIKYSPSPSFVKILEEIKNSLKTGSDLEKSLKTTLEGMTKDHLLEIKAYGKKLSPLSMIYMIIGTIAPSLGSAIMVIGLGFLPDLAQNIASHLFIFLTIGLIVLQFFFILFFRALKPQVMA